MQGYKSALSWYYYQNSERKIEPAIDAWTNEFVAGYKRIVADKKLSGIMPIQEGKSALSFPGFVIISEYMMKLKPEDSRKGYSWSAALFAWLFMVFCWNLIARSNSVANIMLQHIDWKMDALVVTFAKHKGDQAGEGLGNQKHVFANSENPFICCILCLAVFTWCKQRCADSTMQQLFEGADCEGRFCTILNAVLKMIPVSANLGALIKDLGSHSNRKGAASFILSLCECISAVCVYLRAGWTLGNVQDRYIFAGISLSVGLWQGSMSQALPSQSSLLI